MPLTPHNAERFQMHARDGTRFFLSFPFPPHLRNSKPRKALRLERQLLENLLNIPSHAVRRPGPGPLFPSASAPAPVLARLGFHAGAEVGYFLVREYPVVGAEVAGLEEELVRLTDRV